MTCIKTIRNIGATTSQVIFLAPFLVGILKRSRNFVNIFPLKSDDTDRHLQHTVLQADRNRKLNYLMNL